MAKTKIEIEVDLDDNDSVSKAEGKVKSLKQRLGEMKELLASGTLDEKAFTKLSAEAGQLQDRIADVNQRVKNLASDSQKLDGFVDLAQGIVGGFAAVQGITALVGEENEDLQKTMVKLQAVMTALNGIQAIANTLNKDSAAITALQTVRTTVLTAAQAAYTIVVGTSTGAMKAFRIALAASGIGLIVIALIAAAEAMGAFGDSTDETTEEIKKQTDALREQAEAYKELDNASLELTAKKIEVKKAELKLNGASNAELLKQDRELLEVRRGFLKEQLKDVASNAELRKKAQLELQKNSQDILLNTFAQAEAAEEERKKRQEERDKKEKERRDKLHKESMEFDERLKKERMDAFQEQLQEQEARVELEKKQAEERLARVVQQRDGELALRRALRERDRLEAEQERKDFEEVWTAKTTIAQSGYSILNSLGELALGQQFKQTAAGKVLAIAQIATDTALAFVSGLRIAQQSAQGTGPGAAFAFPVFYASQAAAILSVAAKAKSILSGGGSAGVGVPSIGNFSSQPPRLDTFTPTSSTSDPIRNLKVYVVEKEMTGAQDRNARIRDNAEIF